jgi:hypothetical protein
MIHAHLPYFESHVIVPVWENNSMKLSPQIKNVTRTMMARPIKSNRRRILLNIANQDSVLAMD